MVSTQVWKPSTNITEVVESGYDCLVNVGYVADSWYLGRALRRIDRNALHAIDAMLLTGLFAHRQPRRDLG